MYLLEALVALTVFSIGMLGLLGLVASALRASGGATWRSEGFAIAADALALIAMENPASVPDRYDAAGDGAGYRALRSRTLRLPGTSGEANAPGVTIDDTGERRRVRVVVHWQAPGEPVHQASIHATLPHP